MLSSINKKFSADHEHEEPAIRRSLLKRMLIITRLISIRRFGFQEDVVTDEQHLRCAGGSNAAPLSLGKCHLVLYSLAHVNSEINAVTAHLLKSI